MAWTKAKTSVIAGAVLILAAGTTTLVLEHSKNHPRPKLTWTPDEKQRFDAENSKRVNDAKFTTLSCILFLNTHQNQCPKTFAELKAAGFGGPQFQHLSDLDWEIVSDGKIDMTWPMTILFREKKPRPSPDGKFVKIYGFVDGSVRELRSPDGDFSALEKQNGFSLQHAKN